MVSGVLTIKINLKLSLQSIIYGKQTLWTHLKCEVKGLQRDMQDMRVKGGWADGEKKQKVIK